jgi:hypothetical protein
MKPLQQMGLLLAANFETLIYVIMAWWSARYLNEQFPRSFDWAIVTYVLGLLMILRSWYVLFRSLTKAQKGQNAEKKDS